MFRMTGIVTEWGVLLTILLLSLIILRYLHWWIYNPLRHIPGRLRIIFIVNTKTYGSWALLSEALASLKQRKVMPNSKLGSARDVFFFVIFIELTTEKALK